MLVSRQRLVRKTVSLFLFHVHPSEVPRELVQNILFLHDRSKGEVKKLNLLLVCFSFIFIASFTLQEQVKGDRTTTILLLPLIKKHSFFCNYNVMYTLILIYSGSTCHNTFGVYNFKS